MMRKTLFIALLTFSSLSLFSQIQLDLEAGGSNFTGIGLSTSYKFQLSKTSPLYLAPKIGVGHIFNWENAMTLQFGLSAGYQFNEKHALELSSNASYIFESPFFRLGSSDDPYIGGTMEDGNYLWFNSLDYKFKTGKIRYTIGAGILMHFGDFSQTGHYEHSGDPIPMLKLGIGF